MSGYVGGMSGYVRVSPGVSVPLVRFSAEKTCLAGMPEVCLGMSGYVRVCPGSFKPQRRFSAQKLILAVMPEVCLGMSVVCAGMPGCICTSGTFECAKNSFGGYAGGMSGYVRVCRRA